MFYWEKGLSLVWGKRLGQYQAKLFSIECAGGNHCIDHNFSAYIGGVHLGGATKYITWPPTKSTAAHLAAVESDPCGVLFESLPDLVELACVDTPYK